MGMRRLREKENIGRRAQGKKMGSLELHEYITANFNAPYIDMDR